MENLPRLRPGVKVRQVTTHTHDRALLPGYGKFKQIGHWDFETIPPGGAWEFPLLPGPGMITAVWMTFAYTFLEMLLRRRVPGHRSLWINIFYDGSETPAVSAPVGAFFGNATPRYVHFDSRFLGMTSGGYYCFFPMPFRRSCRIVMQNRDPRRPLAIFAGAVTWNQLPRWEDDLAFFHAHYAKRVFRNSPEVSGSQVPNDPHLLLSETGRGHYVGTSLTIRPTGLGSRIKSPYFIFPYLEGNLKVYVDGERPVSAEKIIEKPVGAPRGGQSLEYTGVEDYFNSGWYYVKGPYSAAMHGCPLRSILWGDVAQYRFHDADAFTWEKEIQVTLTHGEFDHVDCAMESVAYYYKQI
jgi:hypothetical protein